MYCHQPSQHKGIDFLCCRSYSLDEEIELLPQLATGIELRHTKFYIVCFHDEGEQFTNPDVSGRGQLCHWVHMLISRYVKVCFTRTQLSGSYVL